jgi:CubicO group peptidase (beta-lactamase class C family)
MLGILIMAARAQERGPWRALHRGFTVPCLVALALVGCTVASRPIQLSPDPAPYPYAAAIDAFVVADMMDRKLPSVALGVVDGGEAVYARGYGYADLERGIQATPDTHYAIGSITKTFTAALLMQLAEMGRVDLATDFWALLPPSVMQGRRAGGRPDVYTPVWTVASHVAGFPRLPSNLRSTRNDQYNNYSCDELLDALTTVDVASNPPATYRYSNFGYASLGWALGRVEGATYQQLLTDRVLRPLRMRETFFSYSRSTPPTMATGYRSDDPDDPNPLWNHGCLAAQGGLISNVRDMITYLQWLLAPSRRDVLGAEAFAELIAPRVRIDDNSGAALDWPEDWYRAEGLTARPDYGAEPLGTYAERGEFAGQLAADAQIGRRQMGTPWIAVGWHLRRLDDGRTIVEHSGLVGGFASYVGFCPEAGVGVVALTNRQQSLGGKASRILDWLIDQPPPTPVGQGLRRGSSLAIAQVGRR